MHEFNILARGKAVEIELHYSDAFFEGCSVCIDPIKKAIVLRNLLSNAFKFTHRGAMSEHIFSISIFILVFFF